MIKKTPPTFLTVFLNQIVYPPKDKINKVYSMFLKSSYKQFAIKSHLNFVKGKGGLPLIKIDNEYASAMVSIYGAQVLSFKPKRDGTDDSVSEDNELLFVSELAFFEQGKAIKGGIPICWPWFGRDPENLGRQMHGFARNMLWQLEETELTDDGGIKLVLSLSESKESYKLWTHDFKVILTITIGKILRLSLKTVNTGKKAFTITQALHAYFSIADIQKIEVDGLDKVKYIDTVNGVYKTELQVGKVTVNQEVDRIYIDVPARTVLIDHKLKREVAIDSIGSKTTIVWNPWIEISKRSADLTEDAYQRFMCVETANAAEDVIVVEPKQSFIIEAEYTAY